MAEAQPVNVWGIRMHNVRKRKERELNATVWPNDKLRVIPTHHQNAALGRQVLTFRPTEVIDDPFRIKIMDDLGIEYRTVSRAPAKKMKQGAPSGDEPGKGAPSVHLPVTDPPASAPTPGPDAVMFDVESKPEHFDKATVAAGDTVVVHEQQPVGVSARRSFPDGHESIVHRLLRTVEEAWKPAENED